jgi:hypothetical protein
MSLIRGSRNLRQKETFSALGKAYEALCEKRLKSHVDGLKNALLDVKSVAESLDITKLLVDLDAALSELDYLDYLKNCQLISASSGSRDDETALAEIFVKIAESKARVALLLEDVNIRAPNYF